MSVLDDGSILPSFLSMSMGAGEAATELVLNDLRLRIGRIVAAYSPTAQGNVNGKFFEYDVEVDVGAGLTKIYPRAVMSDLFGGVADYMHWSPRISTGTTNSTVDLGTRVLLLCLNGQEGRSVIMGTAKHHGVQAKETTDAGHNLEFQFNGVKANIADDGSFNLFWLGPTKADGTLRDDGDKNNSGTTWKIAKDGSISWTTIEPGKTQDDIQNRITLDHTAGEIDVESSGNINSTSKKKIHSDADEGYETNSSNGGMAVEVKDKVTVKSAGVEFGEATDSMLLGSTHIQDLNSFLTSLTSDVTQLALKLGLAGAAMSVPISGPVAAGPQITAASTGLATMIQDIQQFASKLQMHLSKTHKLD